MAANLKGEGRGAFLREHGIHEVHLAALQNALYGAFDDRGQRITAAAEPGTQRARIRELEREVLRKDRALTEATALVVLKKKWKYYSGRKRSTTRRGGAINNCSAH